VVRPGAVSLVVPLQDEEQTIADLLRSIAAQTRPPDEVMLVDAGSRDETLARAATLGGQLPIRVIAAGRVYPGLARNAGVNAATHAWIALTDGGVVLDDDWLARLAEHAGPDTDVVYGRYEPVCDSYFRECAAIAYVPERNATGTRGPSVASCLLRREMFVRAGGFPAFRAAEDLIFIQRLAETSARAAYAPEAVVRWQIADGVRATFRRFESYSYHNLLAGWGARWHLGLARLYAGLAIAVGGFAFSVGAWAPLIVPAFFVARACKSAYRKRTSFSFRTLAVARVLGAAGVLIVIDLATLVGFCRWLIGKEAR